jgi:PAS domain S-box-containing protein
MRPARNRLTFPGQPLLFNSKANAFLDSIPCAIAVWGLDGLLCALNEQTVRLTGYSAKEVQKIPSFWSTRIHPSDASAFLTAHRRLESGEDSVSCEYRFFPKGQHQERWLNETARTITIDDRKNIGIISVYTDVSELVTLRRSKADENRVRQIRQVLDGLIHEVTNNLQAIRGAFDFLRLAGVDLKQQIVIQDRVEQTNKLIKELSEYFFKPDCETIDSDPAVMLQELAQRMKNDLHKQGIRLQVVQRGPLPQIRIDPTEFRKAIDNVLEFSRTLIPNGGELTIEASLRKIQGERYLELDVSSAGAVRISVSADDVFRPFLRVGRQSVGLSMTLAQEILRRHDGKIVFENSRQKTATFKILLHARRD